MLVSDAKDRCKSDYMPALDGLRAISIILVGSNRSQSRNGAAAN
jgi:hypothetical protein